MTCNPQGSVPLEARTRREVRVAVWAIAGAAVLLQVPSQSASAQAQEEPADSETVVPAVPTSEPVSISIGGQTVSLARLLRHAERSAPAIAVARAEVELADESFGAADPLLPSNPALQIAAGPRVGDNGATDLNLRLILQQPIEIGGQRRLRFDVARAARDSRDHELERVRWEVRRQIRAGYRVALFARRRAVLARQLGAFQRRLIAVARRRLETGDVAPLTLRLAEAEAAQAEQRTSAAVQGYLDACLVLAEVSGWSARQPPEPVDMDESAPSLPSLARLLELASEHHPLLEVRRAAAREATARVALAERDAWPNPSLGALYVYEGAPNGGSPEHVVMGLLTVPIPSFQLKQAERAGADARLEVALAREQAVGALLEVQLRRLRTAAEAAARRAQAYRDVVLPRFEENLRFLERAFELGEIDFLRLSVAQERFLTVQRAALDARADYQIALADLEAYVGSDLTSAGQEEPE
jgi:cobalt-zinc-cadmium efflux system outer membrane protein